MQIKTLHIVSFDNPFPPVYGGVIDVFYKVKALHGEGFAIYLHCFVDKPSVADPELLKYVKEVHFYRRYKKNVFKLISRFPFAVVSRYSKKLAANLNKVDAPILFEGLQTTFLTNRHEFGSRKLLLRLHNLEANYFAGMQKSETNPVRKRLYWLDAYRYRPYQQIIKNFDKTLTLSVFETDYVREHYGNAAYVPVFHGNKKVAELSGSGKYAFYHGDLRMADNKRAVDFLVTVFSKIPDYPLVIASGCGEEYVQNRIGSLSNISYVRLESQQQLDQLLAEAHLNVMLSFQQSGTKLKLVNALYKSRFCIINANMIDDANIQELCIMAETEWEFIEAVNAYKTKSYGETEVRKNVLGAILNDAVNAKKISEILAD